MALACQSSARRRVPEHGNFLHAEGGAGAHRAMAMLLQHRAAAQLTWLSSAGPKSHLAASVPAGLRYGAGQPNAGPKTCQTLTLELDHQRVPVSLSDQQLDLNRRGVLALCRQRRFMAVAESSVNHRTTTRAPIRIR